VTSLRVIVTGGAGFIGSHIVDVLLERGCEVTVIDDLSNGRREFVDPRANLAVINIQDEGVAQVFAASRPEAVIHCAAQKDPITSVRQPLEDCRTNVLATLNLLELCREHGVGHFVLASTGGAIYGNAPEIPTPESCRPQPISPYGVGKRAAELYLQCYRETHGLRGAAVRYANVYGPRQLRTGESAVVPIFFEAMLNGVPLRIYGQGEQTRDFVYVSDVTDATLAALDYTGPDAVFNVGTGVETTINELFRRAAAQVGYEGEPNHAPERPGEVFRSCLDCRHAKEVLGWEAQTPLDEGLAQTLEWLREHLETPSE